MAIGDGLAEPVGTYLGKKKYVVPSWNLKNRYVRSYAGSACVYLFALLFIFLYRGQFENPQELWTALILFPPVMDIIRSFCPAFNGYTDYDVDWFFFVIRNMYMPVMK